MIDIARSLARLDCFEPSMVQCLFCCKSLVRVKICQPTYKVSEIRIHGELFPERDRPAIFAERPFLEDLKALAIRIFVTKISHKSVESLFVREKGDLAMKHNPQLFDILIMFRLVK